MTGRQTILTVSIAFALVLLGARGPLAGDLSPAKQAIFLARILGYDANLKARAGSAVNIMVLARKGDAGSEAMSDDMLKALVPLESATLLGLPVRVSRLYFSNREALGKAIRDEGIDTIYVCNGLDANLAEISAEARARKALTIAGQQGYLKLGLSLGVFEVGGKNTILVNLEASREEGVVFGPDLLRLATVVK